MRQTDKSPCQKDGHKFVPFKEWRDTAGEDTLLMASLYCEKCGDVIERQVGIWKDFIPKGRKSSKVQNDDDSPF